MEAPQYGEINHESGNGASGTRDGEGAPRSVIRLLLDPTVGSLFAAKLFAAIGTWIYSILAAVVVFEASGSAFLVGAVSIAQFTPQVLFSPWMGALADRGNRRVQAVVGRATSGTGCLILFLWLTATEVTAPSTVVFVIGIGFVMGLGAAISMPAMTALAPAMARRSELPAVIAIMTSPFTIARAAGPAVGALLLVTVGTAPAFGVTALSLFINAGVVSKVRLRTVPRLASSDGSVMAGFSYLRQQPGIALLLVLVVGVGCGVDPIITLGPSLAASYGASADMVASMATAFGGGALLAVLFLGRLRALVGQARMATVGLGVFAGAILALAASTAPVPALTSLFVAGTGMMAAITAVTTTIQQRVPEHFRGRVMAIWGVCFLGSRPLAAAMNGTIADLSSPRLALVVTFGILLAAAILARRAWAGDDDESQDAPTPEGHPIRGMDNA